MVDRLLAITLESLGLAKRKLKKKIFFVVYWFVVLRGRQRGTGTR
jgi:hypothetical protein